MDVCLVTNDSTTNRDLIAKELCRWMDFVGLVSQNEPNETPCLYIAQIVLWVTCMLQLAATTHSPGQQGYVKSYMLQMDSECALTVHQWSLRTLMLVHAGQISTLCCGGLMKPCWGKMNLSSSCTTADKATLSSQACLVCAPCFVLFACGFLLAETTEAAAPDM